MADAVIIEGPLAGGHLGFSEEQLKEPEKYSLPILLAEVLEVIKPYEDKYGRKIPVVVGGGIFDGTDIARMLTAGASGVQMATRFVCTEECDVAPEFKQAYIQAKEEDIIIIKSPVGLPGRAIRNPFLISLEKGYKEKINCPYRCLSTCNIAEARYCIALALINAFLGDMDKALIFCGQNAHRLHKIVTVKELMAELTAEIEAY
jgi:nitronate monooxygenase